VLKGIEGVPEADDVNVSRDDIAKNYTAFNFNSADDIALYEKLLTEGFGVISQALAKIDQIFVDTKFEFGYVKDVNGNDKLIYMDEVGTPDSSRIWDAKQYAEGKIVENSKEGFRQLLLNHFPDPDILLNKERMDEREALARENALPVEVLMDISKTYTQIAEKITGQKIILGENPKEEVINLLRDIYQLIN
jgi:phosphoribosylaminoimidazole-succinocarboxamide synthase